MFVFCCWEIYDNEVDCYESLHTIYSREIDAINWRMNMEDLNKSPLKSFYYTRRVVQ